MTARRKDGMTESGIAQPKAPKDKTLSVAEVVAAVTSVVVVRLATAAIE